MKKTKLFTAISRVGIALVSVVLIIADHVDAPAVAGTKIDLADLYAFEVDNPDTTVLIATVKGRSTSGELQQPHLMRML